METLDIRCAACCIESSNKHTMTIDIFLLYIMNRPQITTRRRPVEPFERVLLAAVTPPNDEYANEFVMLTQSDWFCKYTLLQLLHYSILL